MANVFLKYFRRFLGVEKLIFHQEQLMERNFRMEQEILSALKFNSTIADSKWFIYKSISPGDTAVDYAFFYTLYRVLSSIKPNNIIEFGLGQSSKMVHQYASYFDKHAITVEHDKEWVDFFLQDREGEYKVNIEMLDLETIEYKGEKSITYKNCKEVFKGQKFDLMIVDGPYGNIHGLKYSRPQIIELVQGNITEDFVIIVDDFGREGEKNTVNEVFDYFRQNGIDFVFHVFDKSSRKDHILITTPRLKFLTTI